MGRAYADFYTHPLSTADQSSTSFQRSVKRALRNGYINHRARTKLRPAMAIGALVFRAFPARRREIEFGLRNLPPMDAKGGNRLLDVGSGNGLFLKAAADMGWAASGVEPDPVAANAAAALGLQTSVGRFEELDLPEAHFDVITLCHVIEHFHDPVSVLKKVLRLLKPRGLLWIATPNMSSVGRAAFGKQWIGLDPPRHLVLFGQRSITEALNRAGFAGTHEFLRGRSAKPNFALSSKIARGLKPFEGGTVHLSFGMRLKALWADMMSLRDLTHEEEIVLAARKSA